MSSFSRLLLAAALCAASSAQAAGQLDPGFGSNGAFVSTLPGISHAFDGAVDASGRYVAVGSRLLEGTQSGLVVRLTGVGSLDTTFGGDGDVTLVPPPGYTVVQWRAVALRPDGRIVVAGHVSPAADLVDARPLVCRYLAAGVVDVTFGEGGCTMPPFGPLSPEELVSGMAL